MITRQRARGTALLVGALCLLTGGCKSFFWSGARIGTHDALFGEDDESSTRVLLGVVLDGSPPTSDAGAAVLRVLRQAPAEKAGVQPGDLIVRFGARRIRDGADLVGEVRRWKPGTSAELTVSRAGRERRLTVTLSHWQEHDQRMANWFYGAARGVSDLATGFYHGEALQIEPSEWLAWRGQQLRAPFVLYDDVDVLPFLGVFSLFRLERAPSIGAWRFTFLFWPLMLGSSGDGTSADYLDDLLTEGERSAGHEVL